MPKFQQWKGIMKCYPFEEKRLAKWEPPFIIQPKYDGVRCRAIPLENGSFILLSSQENVIYSVPHINKALNDSKLPRIEFDGELYCHGMSFEEIVSITSRTKNLHYQHKMIKFHIFDIVDEALPQYKRLKKLISLHLDSFEYLKHAPFWVCNTLDSIMETYEYLINNKYEGIIVRHIAAPYERKRSLYVMKFKPKKEDTYAILGFKEEVTNEGTPKGCLGALMCSSREGETFSVGSGFTDEDRAKLWKQREQLKGKTVRIQYQHITSGRGVPRFPIYVEMVEDEKMEN